ncbi:MAG TPA: hypothetical protein VF064_03505 [Pyrinomonadaceae bacterium]
MRVVVSKPVSLIASLSAALVLLVAEPSTTFAQGRTRPAPRRAAPAPVKRTSGAPQPPSIRERQFKMHEMEREAAHRRTPEEERLALAQIAEDYERIQLVNNKMMAAAFGAAAPDYGNIATVTAEIGKRAGRLKTNLHLPPPTEPESKQPPPAEPGDAAALKKLLLSLDKSLMSFVRSPVFDSVNVIDAGAAATARADLETVIELSHFISKCARKMSKDAAKH